MKNNKKVFRTRVSVLTLVLILLCFLPIIIPMITRGITVEFWIVIGVLLLCIYLIIDINYTISDNTLIIRMFSVNSTRIVISNITSITRSYNPISSPASSLKRLRVNYKPNLKNSYILISPTREQEFIDTMKSINPNIEINISNKKELWRIQDWDI